MAREAGLFDAQDVINGICDKLVRRHPHVFADHDAQNAEAVVTSWEAIKAAERQDKSGRPKRTGRCRAHFASVAPCPEIAETRGANRI